MAAKNNFKKLEEEQMKENPHTPPDIENNIKGSMRLFHFMGDIVELYLPKVFDLVLSLVGADRNEQAEEGEEAGELDDEDAPPNGEQIPK